ncbi:MAG: right-handed parallel beta-helix repeat-containing protein [Candidatus Nanoarchaeia archaeon]
MVKKRAGKKNNPKNYSRVKKENKRQRPKIKHIRIIREEVPKYLGAGIEIVQKKQRKINYIGIFKWIFVICLFLVLIFSIPKIIEFIEQGNLTDTAKANKSIENSNIQNKPMPLNNTKNNTIVNSTKISNTKTSVSKPGSGSTSDASSTSGSDSNQEENECTPLSCKDYPMKCSSLLSDNCTGIIDCSNNCNYPYYCNESDLCEINFTNTECINQECNKTEDICMNNSIQSCRINQSNGCFYLILEECTEKETCLEGECVLCIPESNETTCSQRECGNITNNCNEAIECGKCASGYECSGAGACIKEGLEDYLLSQCSKIITPNAEYYLEQDITSSPSEDKRGCIDIDAENVTFDCRGHKINYIFSSPAVYSEKNNIAIKNCAISIGKNSLGYGIMLNNSKNAYIFNNSIKSMIGIYAINLEASLIKNNNIENCFGGIEIIVSNNNVIDSNAINENKEFGIYLKSSNSSTIVNNFQSLSNFGLIIENSFRNKVSYSGFYENNIMDVKLKERDRTGCTNDFSNVNVSFGELGYYTKKIELKDKVFSELILCKADYSRLDNITIKGSAKNNNGLMLIQTKDSVLSNIDSSGNYYGLYIEGSNNIVNKSFFSKNNISIYVNEISFGNIISSNIISDSGYGIYLYDSKKTSVLDNEINKIKYSGIRASGELNLFESNKVSECIIGFESYSKDRINKNEFCWNEKDIECTQNPVEFLENSCSGSCSARECNKECVESVSNTSFWKEIIDFFKGIF